MQHQLSSGCLGSRTDYSRLPFILYVLLETDVIFKI